MPATPSPSTLRLLAGIMIGASVTLIGIALWMIFKHEGSPVFVAVAGSMLAAFAAVIGSRAKNKS